VSLTAARLYIQSLDEIDTAVGFYWACNLLEESHEHVVTHLELEQAIKELKRKEFTIATKMLKELHQKHSCRYD
jgi:hypothetical protein